jgi:hypothetical protein
MDLICSGACVAATLCPQAQTDAGFLALWDELRARDFVQQGEPHAMEVRDAGSLARSIVLVPLRKAATGESASLGWSVETSGERRALAAIADERGVPIYALLVDGNGQVVEAEPDPSTSRTGVAARDGAARGAAGACESECEDDCEWGVGLSGAIFATAFGLAAIGTGGLTAVISVLLSGATGGLALYTGLKCDDLCTAKCRCPMANCKDACNRERDTCEAACVSGASAVGKEAIPPTCTEACMDAWFDCHLACDETCAS